MYQMKPHVGALIGVCHCNNLRSRYVTLAFKPKTNLTDTSESSYVKFPTIA